MTLLQVLQTVLGRNITQEDFSIAFCQKIGGCEKCPLINQEFCYLAIEEMLTKKIVSHDE